MPPKFAYWLLTSSTYGTWLPGDRRGSVTSVRDRRLGDPRSERRIEHDRYGDAFEPAIAGLARSSRASMRGAPVRLTGEQARVVCEQFQETAQQRDWQLFAASVMANHFHLVVAAPNATRTEILFRDFKVYASKALNERFGQTASGTWWTRSGSRRRLYDEEALYGAIDYTLNRQRRVHARFVARTTRTDCPSD